MSSWVSACCTDTTGMPLGLSLVKFQGRVDVLKSMALQSVTLTLKLSTRENELLLSIKMP